MRIRTISIFFVLVTFSFTMAQNQDSIAIKKYYEENVILWTGWTRYYKNYQSYPLRNLKNEIVLSPDALNELALYKENRTYLEIGAITTAGLFISSFLVKDREAKLGLLAGSIIGASISLPFSFKTSSHLSKSIWFHNRDILLR